MARGNVIKIDRHKYVKIAYHGLHPLPAADRKSLYSSGPVRDSFDGPGYTTIDTLFSLAEALLFMQVVEMKDSGECAPSLLPARPAARWGVTGRGVTGQCTQARDAGRQAVRERLQRDPRRRGPLPPRRVAQGCGGRRP